MVRAQMTDGLWQHDSACGGERAEPQFTDCVMLEGCQGVLRLRHQRQDCASSTN
jgi:hypothetical protein